MNVQEEGNVASASLPIVLDEAWRKGMAKPGSQVLLVAFGSSFAWASALLKM